MVNQTPHMPKCAAARECGACQHVNEPYAAQLRAKDARMAKLFGREAARALWAGPGGNLQLRPIIGMQDPFHYRNKVISPFAPGKRRPDGGREVLTGMYAAGTHRLVSTDGCLVENEQARRVVRAVRLLVRKHRIEPYDEDRGTGFLRHVVVRVGHESGEVLVTLVTNTDEFPASKSFCRALVKQCPFVTTVVQNVNTRQTNVVLGQEERRLYGPGFILDTLCGLSFRISSQSFYQVNAVQTTVLYETAMQFAGLGASKGEGLGGDGPDDGSGGGNGGGEAPAGPGAVIDAYCGTGTIGLVAAKRGAAQVIGVDSVESAIRDARENARHNGIENARFVTADATGFMRGLARDGERADVVFMDPPRAGSTPEFLDALAQLAPSRVVYISCNPETQVRDLLHLAEGGYVARIVQPIDMFPHTDHVETVVLLTKGREEPLPANGKESR